MSPTQSHLVPWNLFFSASAVERPGEMSWEAVEDFSALVDHFCLNNKLIVLGDPHHRLFLTHDTEFFSAIRDSHAVEVWHPRQYPDSEQGKIVTTAKDHLRSLFRHTPANLVDAWIQHALSLNEVASNLEDRATMNIDVRVNPPLCLRSPSVASLRTALLMPDADPKIREFVIRTIIYLAYAEYSGLPWAPDSLRRPLMEMLLSEEKRLLIRGLSRIESLKRELRTAWETDVTYTPQEVDSRRRISPFAAVVFTRCRGVAGRIPDVMFALRHELRELRQDLVEIDERIRTAPTRSAETRARRAWLRTLERMRRTYGSDSDSGTVTWERAFAPAKTTMKAISGTAGPSEYLDMAKHMLEAVGAVVRRRRFVRLFHLKRDLPGTGRLDGLLKDLFPKHFDNGRWLHVQDDRLS